MIITKCKSWQCFNLFVIYISTMSEQLLSFKWRTVYLSTAYFKLVCDSIKKSENVFCITRWAVRSLQ